MSAQTPSLRVGVIGMGHVGPSIASALRAAGHIIVGVSASSPQSHDRIESMLPGIDVLEVPELIGRSELVILTIPDDEIASVVSGAANLGLWRPSQLVVHMSGAYGIGILTPAQAQGALPMAIHPAMTFSGTSLDIARMVGTPFAVTAPAQLIPIAQALVVELGGEPVVIQEEQRALYHAALNHGSHHGAAVVSQARRILQEAGVEDTGAFLRPLVEAAIDRVLREGESGLSGPATRSDAGTLTRHMSALRESAEQYHTAVHERDRQELSDATDTYAFLSRKTIDMLKRSGHLHDVDVTSLNAALTFGASGITDGQEM